MTHRRWILFLILILGTTLAAQPDTVRIASYNILNFPGVDYTTRIPFFRTSVRYLNTDIFVVQEMESQTGVNFFLSQVLPAGFQAVPFHDGPDTDNALFFRQAKFSLSGASYITTALRDIGHYILIHISSGEPLHIFSVHLKASQGTTNEQKRLAEAAILKTNLLSLPANSNYIVLGDFNIYTSSEPAFQHLTADGTCLDPLNAPGNWHNNYSFAAIHTQSPRAESFGGGSSGGLDDRFDLILIADDLADNLISSSYTSFGNDGQHFNQSINTGTNNSVPDSVADALYFASDHLPVYCDFVFTFSTNIGNQSHAQFSSPVLVRNYPNPFNPETVIEYYLPSTTPVDLEIYNLLGQQIAQLFHGILPAGTHRISWRPEPQVAGGMYYLSLKTAGSRRGRRIIFAR